MMLLRPAPLDMAADGFRHFDSAHGYADRAGPALGHLHKRRRTGYLTSQHEPQDTSTTYGGSTSALLAHSGSSSFAPYTSQPPAAAEQPFFMMHDHAASQQQHHHQTPPPPQQHPHQHQHQQQQQQQHQQHQQHQLYDSMASSQYSNYVHEPALITPSSDTSSQPWDPLLFDPSLQLKVQSLPVLDNLATKILENLANSNLQEVIETTTQPDSGRGQAYSTLVALFDQTKKYYSREQLFLNPQLLNLDQSSYGIIRKANIATFAVAIFSGRDIPFSQLHEHCLDVFCPDGRSLTKSVASLVLELKTQAFISALHNGGNFARDSLEFFPPDFESQLARRKPGQSTLTPIDQDLIMKVNIRSQEMMSEQFSSHDLRLLYSRFQWVDLLRILNECIRQGLPAGLSATGRMSQDYAMMYGSSSTSPISAHQPSSGTEAFPLYHEATGPGPQRTLSQRSFTRQASGRERSVSSTARSEGGPMQLQYEKARASSTSKATPPSRRVSVASQRKPWSQEEEKALMDGLDRVKGPHWSQILALYGVGGRISEALKERTQVQLKDKARNLKLFFLKSGNEVPTYLQGVTGELKTRAPAQAAKREREERLKAEREAMERQQHEHAAQQQQL